MFLSERGTNVCEFSVGIRLAHHFENGESFVDAVARGRPPGAARNKEEQRKKDCRGDGGYADLPAPLCGSEMKQADDVVRGVSDEDAEDDIELESPDETSAP